MDKVNYSALRGVLAAATIFAALFALALYLSYERPWNGRASDEGGVAKRFIARLCPMGPYDFGRGTIQSWRGSKVVVAEKPWSCLSDGQKTDLLIALHAQNGRARASSQEQIAVHGAESGRRLALIGARGAVLVR